MRKLIKTDEKLWLIFFVWLSKSFQDTIAKLKFMMQVNEQQQRALLLLVNSNNGVDKPCLGVGAKMVKVKGLCLEPRISKTVTRSTSLPIRC